MDKLNTLQLLGLQRKEDSIAILDDEIKEYLTEIVTLRHIRQEQMQTISQLRSENFRLKNELRQLKGE